MTAAPASSCRHVPHVAPGPGNLAPGLRLLGSGLAMVRLVRLVRGAARVGCGARRSLMSVSGSGSDSGPAPGSGVPGQVDFYARFSPSPLSMKQFLDFGECAKRGPRAFVCGPETRRPGDAARSLPAGTLPPPGLLALRLGTSCLLLAPRSSPPPFPRGWRGVKALPRIRNLSRLSAAGCKTPHAGPGAHTPHWQEHAPGWAPSVLPGGVIAGPPWCTCVKSLQAQ